MFFIRLLSIFIFVLQLGFSFGQWTKKANLGGVGRHRATGISIGNKGYIGLGHTNGTGINIDYKDWWQYDPASDSWTQRADFPVLIHGAVSFGTDTKGYVGGGSTLTSEFFEYNPITNCWLPIAPCPLSPGDVQCFSVQNKGYVYFGNQLAQYDPTSNAWAIMANAPISFNTWSTSFASNGSGYIKSGTSLYEFKPSQNTWIARAQFPGLSSNGGAGFYRDNKGYYVCGYVGSLSVVSDEVWEFNPGENSWKLISIFPGTARRFPVAFAIGDKGYLGTGTNGVNLNDFWCFDYDPLGTSKLNVDDIGLQAFPNPSSTEIELSLREDAFQVATKSMIEVYTVAGKRVMSEVLTGHAIRLHKAQFGEGVFLCRITLDNTSIVKKLIFE
jgi:N-acetylneuraminic acid mutarotase